MKLLFICSYGKNRSPTAEDLFKGEHETLSLGLYESPSSLSLNKNLDLLIGLADKIFVMEESHRKTIINYYLNLDKEIINLEIPDNYLKGDPSLVALLRERVTPHLTRL